MGYMFHLSVALLTLIEYSRFYLKEKKKNCSKPKPLGLGLSYTIMSNLYYQKRKENWECSIKYPIFYSCLHELWTLHECIIFYLFLRELWTSHMYCCGPSTNVVVLLWTLHNTIKFAVSWNIYNNVVDLLKN